MRKLTFVKLIQNSNFMPSKPTYDSEITFQSDRRKSAVEFIKIVSDLWYDYSIELVMFRNQLMDQNVSEILKLHAYAGEFVNKPISIFDSVEMALAIKQLNLPASKLDIGKLTYEYHKEDLSNSSSFAFLSKKLKKANQQSTIKPKDVVLYGFGRIGRLVARELMGKSGSGSQLRLRDIVTSDKISSETLEKRAALLRSDSVHGDFQSTVSVDKNLQALIINGMTVYVISASKPENIDYTAYGINKALVIDNTGVFRKKEELKRHLVSKGAEKVLLTAPCKEIANIVYGVNHLEYSPDKIDIFSAASCTTNAITPILKVIEDSFCVEHGHLETIHAYTNDQNLVDNMHSKYRRGRAAALNMVITETGAGKAVSKALPALKNKLTSNAIRVPVPNGSLAILNLKIKKNTTLKKINNLIKTAALTGNLVEQIKYELNDELVSSDVVGCTAPAIYDSKATIVRPDGKNVIMYIWYDNEFGYSHQVIRLSKYIAKVRRFTYY